MRPHVFLQMPLRSLVLILAISSPQVSFANSDQRILVVRERNTASLLNDSFTFQLMKIRGYSIDVKFDGARQKLKIGEAFSPAQANCSITFEEVASETQIARFKTDCP